MTDNNVDNKTAPLGEAGLEENRTGDKVQVEGYNAEPKKAIDDLEPNTLESIDFLKKIHPEGVRSVTAIAPDRQGIETKVFACESEKALYDFISKYQDKRNIYYNLNPVCSLMNKKAEREDIESVNYLHVDIDPRPDEDIDEERARILSSLENFEPAPTAVIDSGGGFQALWKLLEPIPINGDLAKAEEAKLYNVHLESMLGADNCHNIDRILRLPGTINIPDARKKKKGRKKALAKLCFWDDNRIYPIECFTKAHLVQTSELGFSGNIAKVSGNIPRLESIDDLPENVPGWVKALAVQGQHPDDPNKYPSRSEAVFAFCCAMVRAGVDDNTIFSVITDPDFRISESILNKGKNTERYAIRQIERAREEAIDPWLRKLNEKHAVIGDMGGKCRVISEVYDAAMKRTRINRQSFEDFRNRYMNKTVQVGENNGTPQLMQLGKWWVLHPNRREFDTMLFLPGKNVPGVYNLWKGHAYDSKLGDKHEKFLKHVFTNICRNNAEQFEYVVNWMARCVQHPDSPGEVAIVLRGKRGTGKTLFATVFGSLFGRHFLSVADPKHLVGSFNAHLRDCVVLLGDEAFYAGDKKHEGILKVLITSDTLTIEAKGVDAETAPNYIHLILASNSDWIVPAGIEERRFCVLDVNDQNMQDSQYFGGIMQDLREGGYENLLHFLMHRDISDFDHRKVPVSEALLDQKLLSLDLIDQCFLDIATNGASFDEPEYRRVMPNGISAKCIIDKVTRLAKEYSYSCPVNLNQLIGRRLKRLSGLNAQKNAPYISARGVNGKVLQQERRSMYPMPPLEVFRQKEFPGFDPLWRDMPSEWVHPDKNTQASLKLEDDSDNGIF